MMYELIKQIRENGGATKEDLVALEPYLTTGPIKFDNSRFYKNVEFINKNYDILYYVTRDIDVSYIENEKLAEIVFYLNIFATNANYNSKNNTIEFKACDVCAINNLFLRHFNFWNNYYNKTENPFILKSTKNIHHEESFELIFNTLDDKVLDLILYLIYKHKLFKITEALPRKHDIFPRPGYIFLIDHRSVNESEFKAYRNKVEKFLDNMVNEYELKEETE